MSTRRQRILVALLVALLALAALVWPIWQDFRQEIATQTARIQQGSRIVATACGAIEIAEAGTGPALLLIHGSGGGFDQGLALAEAFVPAGWRVIAPSRFGYLRTPWPQVDAKADIGKLQADHLACLLDSLGLTDAAVLGVSAGAIAATEFAARHPRRTHALILVVPAAYRATSAPALPGWAQGLLEMLVAGDLPYWLASRWAGDTLRATVLATPAAAYADAPAAERARADRMQREILPLSARARGLLHDTLATQQVPRPAFENITAPTLVISARDDAFGTLVSAQAAAGAIGGARLRVFDRGGHLLLGHRDAVAAAVGDLLRGQRTAPPG